MTDTPLALIPHSLREPGPGRCLYCHATVERYRTAGNAQDTGSPLLAAFTPDDAGSWRLGLDAVMHRRPTNGSYGGAYSVHICEESA